MRKTISSECIGRLDINASISETFRDGFLKLLKDEKERMGKYSKDFHVWMEFSAGTQYSVMAYIWIDDSQWEHPLWPKVELHIREETRT